MSHWLLFLQADQSGYAVELPQGRISYGPSEAHFDMRLQPDNNDDLYRSADAGGQQAYKLLWREGYLRQSATILFRPTDIPINIHGHSADLLFALAVVTSSLPRVQGFPTFAATGALDDNGFVQSVEGVPLKLRAVIPKLHTGSIIFFPKADESKIDSEIRQLALERDVVLFPVDRLDQAVAKLGITIRKIYLKEPYRGLETFEAEHRGIYFGRQADIETLRERLLAREANQTPGILIVAASGAGKSSLVQAGLIPALEEGPLVLQDRPIFWSVWRPRNTGQAFDETALVDSVTSHWNKHAYLQGLTAPKTLAHLADQLYRLMPKERRFLWVIDQMEELFTLGFSDEVVKCFADFLLRLQEIGVWVISTLRSDFYDRYQQQPALLDVFGDFGVYNLRNLDATALDQIIEAPAKLADLNFETDATGVSLATQLREDMGGKIDALPLLEFALKILYISRDQQGHMTYRSYRETGGLFGAIGQRAETAFKTLDESARDSLPLLLWKLIAKPAKEDNQKQFAAQTVNINDFPPDDPVMRLIEAFTKERLLVRDKDDQNTVRVRVAHEAFFSHWARAKSIIEGFLQDKQLHDRLKDQVVDWKADGQLLTAGLLNKADDLLGRLRPLLDTDVIELIGASVQAEQTHRESELMHLQDQLAEQKRRAIRDRSIMIILLMLTSGVGVMGAWAYQAKQEANKEKIKAEQNFASARKTVDEFVADISSKELADIPGLQELRETFARKAIAKYTDFIKLNPYDSDVQIGYARVKGMLGSILADIGSTVQSENEMREAIELLEINVKSFPNEWRYSLELAKQKIELARWYYRSTRTQEAIPLVNKAIAELTNLLSQPKQQNNQDVIFSLADAYKVKGNTYNTRKEGLGDYERSIKLAEQIEVTYPDKIALFRLISAGKENISLAYKSQNDYQKSLVLLDEGDSYLQKALKLSPNSPDLLSDNEMTLSNKAQILTLLKQPEEAKSLWEQSLKVSHKLVDDNPKVTRYSWYLAESLTSYASFLSSLGDYGASQKTYEEAASILERITQSSDDRPHYGVALVEVLDSLASFQQGSKGNIPKDDKAWKTALERMLSTARKFQLKYPNNQKIAFELSQSLARIANFETEINKDNEAAARNYQEALTLFSEKAYTGQESPNSSDVSNFLSFSESAMQMVKELNRLDEAKRITELAYRIGKSHTSMAGVQSLGGIFGNYGGMLQKAKRYPEAIEAMQKQLEIAKPTWEKNDWNWWLRQEVGGANYHLAELYQATGNQYEEILARQNWLRVWGDPMHSIDSKDLLAIDASSATPEMIKKIRDATGEKAGGGMKRFTIPTDFNGVNHPFHIYITNIRWPNDPLGGQGVWLENERGGKIPNEVVESFRRLQKIAHEHNVSFVDLAVYAMGMATTENDSSKTDEKIIMSIANTVLHEHLNTEPNPAVSTDGIGLAIKGYDPVAYFAEKKPVKGVANYFTVWDKALWFFVSDENRKRFVANPTGYAPVFGGFCTYCMGVGHKLHGEPDAWSVYQDKLYLHKNTELRDKWLKDPDSFLKLAHAEWINKEKIKVDPDSNSAVSTKVLEYIKNGIPKVTETNSAAKVSGQDVKPDDNSVPDKEKKPNDLKTQLGLVVDLDEKAKAAKSKGKLSDAFEKYLEALKIIEPIASEHKSSLELQAYLADLYSNIGSVLNDQDDRVLAVSYIQKSATLLEDIMRRFPDKASPYKEKLASILGNLSFDLLFTKDYLNALTTAHRALELNPSNIWVKTNEAHALLFLNRFDEAKVVYLDKPDQVIERSGRNFRQAVFDDFKELRNKNISHPDMEKIEAMLKTDIPHPTR